MTARQNQPKARRRFAICVDPGPYQVDLERWKIYQLLPDADAARHQMVRVIDESGEDYLFPRTCFKPITLPPGIGRRFHARTAV